MRKGKKIVFTGKNKIEIKDFTIESPRKNEVLIKTVNSLVSSGTEKAILTGTHIGFTDRSIGYPPYPFYPFEPGFCATGNVVSVGKEVSKLKPGDAVFVPITHATHAIVSANPYEWKSAWKIPKEESYIESCFTFLGMVALLAIKVANIKLGESVLIVGQGVVGQLTLQLAKLSGATPVIVADIYDNRLDISKVYGASYAINPKKSNLEQQLKKITGGKGVNVVIEASGNSIVFPTALKVASKLGRIVILGSPRGKIEVDLYTDLFRKGLSLIGAHGSIWPKEGNVYHPWTEQWARGYILNLLSKGFLQVDKLITDKVNFERAPMVYEKIIRSPENTLGVIFDYSSFQTSKKGSKIK